MGRGNCCSIVCVGHIHVMMESALYTMLGLRSMLVFDFLPFSIICQLPGVVVVVIVVVVLMVDGCVTSWLCKDGSWLRFKKQNNLFMSN